MDKELADTIDTISKIGLGAVIAGFFGWLSTRQNHNFELNKDQRIEQKALLKKKEERYVDFLSQSQNLVQTHLSSSATADTKEYKDYLRAFNLLQILSSDEVRVAAHELMNSVDSFIISNKNIPDVDYQKSLRKDFNEKLSYFQKLAQLEVTKQNT